MANQRGEQMVGPAEHAPKLVSKTAERLARQMGGEFVPFNQQGSIGPRGGDTHPVNYLDNKRR